MAGKKILLIIDPQVDFTTGTLAVPGAKEDYERIIKLMNNNKFEEFNEIHVSLDTHNKDHIGHPSFWKAIDSNKKVPELSLLKVENNKIFATPMAGGDAVEITVSLDDNVGNNKVFENIDEKRVYAIDYINKLNSRGNGLMPTIWIQHCVVPLNENDKKGFGHAVASPLKEALDLQKGKVKYHIKGQNNLTEMYSIFGAEYESDKALEIQGPQPNVEGHPNYNAAKTATNQYVARNEELMERLLNEGKNTVYVCGQARTHCVKESLKHLLQYAKKRKYDIKNIILLHNMSSPILGRKGVLDNILYDPELEGLNAKNVIIYNSEQNPHITDVRRLTQGGKRRRRKTKKRHNKKPKRKVTKKRHHKKTKKRKVRKTKKNKTRKR